MKFFFETTEITEEQARSGEDTQFGLQLEAGSVVAWDCYMLGGGGQCGSYSDLARLLSNYKAEPEFDPAEGPDEIIYTIDGKFFYLTITVE